MNKFLLLLAAVGLSAVVFASDPPAKLTPPPPPPATFEQLDRNQDGLVSLTEATRAAWTHEQFDLIDRDDDGAIDPREYSARG